MDYKHDLKLLINGQVDSNPETLEKKKIRNKSSKTFLWSQLKKNTHYSSPPKPKKKKQKKIIG